jgi:ABC-2 type transport system permease protein
MTAASVQVSVSAVHGREAGFARDVLSVAGRALLELPREPAPLVMAVFVPAFFYTTNIGMFSKIVHQATSVSYKAFLIPMAIAFAVTGMSRAPTLVADITSGYFDRLCMTPARRSALLLGMMAADVVIIVALCLPVLAIGFAVGVRFAAGPGGVALFLALSAMWGWAFAGIPYAIALRTASPAAIGASYGLFFPLFFLSDAVVPKQALAGWYQTIASYNPVTYLVEALRSLILAGWEPGALVKGVLALGGLGLVSMSMAMLALRGRVSRRR